MQLSHWARHHPKGAYSLIKACLLMFYFLHIHTQCRPEKSFNVKLAVCSHFPTELNTQTNNQHCIIIILGVNHAYTYYISML